MFFFIFEKISFFLNNVLFILLCIALFTLIERKVMNSVQRRKGPNLTGLLGFLQPFADGLKLLIKEIIVLSNSNFYIFILSPMIIFFFKRYCNIFILKYTDKIFNFSKRFYSRNNWINNRFSKENYVNKNIKSIVETRSISLRAGFLSEVKYEANCFNIFNPFFSVYEKQLIKKALLEYVCSEYYENAPETVSITMDSDEHYLFYVDGLIDSNVFKRFIGNMMVFEFKKKEIFFKKKKLYYYYILYLKYDDIWLSPSNESESNIQKYICEFSVSWYFPPYEAVQDFFIKRSAYDKFFRHIDSPKYGYDFSNIHNLDQMFQVFVDVYDREMYSSINNIENLSISSKNNNNET